MGHEVGTVDGLNGVVVIAIRVGVAGACVWTIHNIRVGRHRDAQSDKGDQHGEKRAHPASYDATASYAFPSRTRAARVIGMVTAGKFNP